MGIPEEDLTTMASIGAQTTSKETYATVKLALEAQGTGFAAMNYNVFLQGSYGNDTNIRKESDVDVVIRLDAIFTYDLSLLPPEQKLAFERIHGPSAYTQTQFREDVLSALVARFGEDVKAGTKAVMIEARHNRRKADVLIAIQHHKYSRYVADTDKSSVIGLSFHKSDGSRVVNYPTQHRDNMVVKNQATKEWFKHIVRIFKNARQNLVEQSAIELGVAPSYYIEGLLYNVPVDCFGPTYSDSMVKCIKWLIAADRSMFTCAHRQFRLLDGNKDVTWNTNNCDAYLNGLVRLWNEW